MPTDTQIEDLRSRNEIEKRVLERSFAVFVRKSWKVLHPFEDLVDGQYIDALAEWAQSVFMGLTRRSIINQPPRTLKSTIFSVMFPCWAWTIAPWLKFIFFSWSFDKLSVPLSVERRRLLMSPWYQERWEKRFALSWDEQMKWMFSNDKTGRMTVLTGATGIGGNFLIIDDPHNTEEAESDAERQACVRKVRNGLMTRLDNPQSDSVIVVMQRLHDSDVSGSFLKDGGWSHLCIQAKAEKKQTIILPVMKTTWVREEGDLLDPVRLPDAILEEKKRELGTKGFYGQYQQEPAPPGGLIFKAEWWRWWKTLPEMSQVVVSVDCAFKGKDSSDDVAVHAWGIAGINSFLMARDTRKMGFAATKAAIRAMVSAHGATTVLIEDKANGPAIIDELKTEFYVVAIDPGFGDKVARAEGCSPMVEAGTVYLPESADSEGKQGTGVKIQTLASKFPNAEKDDIDALTQFLNWRRKHSGTMEWFKAQALKAQGVKVDDDGNVTEEERPRIEHPTVQEVNRLAMEAAGMKVRRPEQTKQVKPTDLKKDEPQPQLAPTRQCTKCGSTAISTSKQGARCNSCGNTMPVPTASKEKNIG